MRFFVRLCILPAVLLFGYFPSVQAQYDYLPKVGIKDFTNYQSTDIDSVDLSTGNVNLHIPLVSFPQKGNKLRLNFFIRYNEPQWMAVLGAINPTPSGYTSSGFWKINDAGTPRPIGVDVVRDQGITGTSSSTQRHGVGSGGQEVDYATVVTGVRDRTGAEHPVAIDSGVTGAQQVQFHAPDGSGWHYDPNLPGVIRDKDGLTYTPFHPANVPGTLQAWDISDDHTNKITTASDGWHDSMDNWIPGSWDGHGAGSMNSPSGSPPAEEDPFPGVPSSEMARCNNGAVATRTWKVPSSADIGNGYQYYYFCYSSYSANTQFDFNGIIDGNITTKLDDAKFTAVLLSKIILPDGTAYSFQYDPLYLDLLRIDLPTGGSITYDWENIKWDVCSTALPMKRVVWKRTVNSGGNSSGSIWLYKWGTNGLCNPTPADSIDVIVTNPDLNDESHHYGIASGSTLVRDIDYYQGSATATPPVLLKRVETTAKLKLSALYLSKQDILYDDTSVSPPVAAWRSGGGSTPEYFPGPVEKTVTTLYDPVTQSTVQSSQETDTVSLPSTGNILQWNPDLYASQTPGSCACINYSEIGTERDYDAVQGAMTGPGALLRRIETDYRFLDNDGQRYFDAGLTNLPSKVVIFDGQGRVAQTEYAYDEGGFSAGGTAGELTTTKKWAGQKVVGTDYFISTHTNYSSLGTWAGSIDGKQIPTIVTAYDCSGLFPSNIVMASGTPVYESVTYTHDCNTGSVKSYIDANGNTTTYNYADPLNRIKSVSFPDMGHVDINYIPSTNGSNSSTNIVTQTGGPQGAMSQTVTYDLLGRTIKVQKAVPSPANTVSQDTTYDLMGRVWTQSNPYFSMSDPTYGITTKTYDALGRLIQTQNSDNGPQLSSLQTWTYAGNTVDFFDELNVHWKRTYDGLGRLGNVMELGTASSPLNLQTVYTYSALGDLVKVNQIGANGELPRVRNFTYDPLSRLITASNSESAVTVCYGIHGGSGCVNGYDDNGNLLAQLNGRDLIFYSYDELNRLVSKTYQGTTPAVTYHYDEPSVSWTSPGILGNTKGRLSSVSVGGANPYSQYAYSYDAMGRTLNKVYMLPNAAGTGLQPGVGGGPNTYDYAGNVTFTGIGPGIYLTQARDVAGQVTSATSNKATTNPQNGVSSNILFTNATYSPFGTLASRTLGNGLTETRDYDQRGRVHSIALSKNGTVAYSVTVGYAANGNVISANDSINGNWGYQYDSLNRLKEASSGTGLVLTWTYDSFGNRKTQTASGTGSAPQTSFTFTNNMNRADPASGMTYYPAGDVHVDNLGQGYVYDAEGRIISATPTTGGTVTYKYDPDGQLIYENGAGGTQLFQRNDAGQAVWIGAPAGGSSPYNNITAYIDGELIGSWQNGGTFVWAGKDWLGTKRYESYGQGDTSSGNTVFLNSYTNLPFGDVLSSIGYDPTHFTGKERDTESGLDYFGARYYGSTMGRFMSPDPIKITDERLLNPANTLNLYSYAANNPLKYVDPDGQDITYFYDPGGVAGHAVLFAYNQQTGDSAIESFGPEKSRPENPGVSNFDMNLFSSAQGLRDNYASLTIQTSPELAQQVIDYIRANPDPSTWKAWGPNCSTQCDKILQKFKLDYQKSLLRRNATPKFLMHNLMSRYNPGQKGVTPKQGTDYGAPRMDMYQMFWNAIQPTTVTTSQQDSKDGVPIKPCGGDNPCN